MCVAPFLLFSWGAQYLPEGLSSIFNATIPIATTVVALAILPDERLTRIKTAGVFEAAAGVVLVAGSWNAISDATDATFLSALGCLGGAA